MNAVVSLISAYKSKDKMIYPNENTTYRIFIR